MRLDAFLLGLTSFFLTLSNFMIWPVFSIYLHDYVMIPLSEIGLITALLSISTALTRIPFSIWVRRGWFPAVFTGSLISNLIALIGYGLSGDPISLSLFRILHGAAFALNYTLSLTFSSMISEEEGVSSSIQLYTAFIALGLFVGPITGTVLLTYIDLRKLMFVASLIGAISVAVGIGFLRETYGVWCGVEASKIGFSDLLNAVKNPGLTSSFLIYLSYSFAYGALISYSPLRAELDFGLKEGFVSLLFFTYFLVVAAVRFMLGRIKRFIGLDGLLMFSLITYSFGMMMLGLSPIIHFFILGFPLIGLAHGFIFPITAWIAARSTTTDLRTIGNALYLTAFDIGSLAGSISASILTGFLPISLTLATLSITPLLGLPILSRMRRMGILD